MQCLKIVWRLGKDLRKRGKLPVAQERQLIFRKEEWVSSNLPPFIGKRLVRTQTAFVVFRLDWQIYKSSTSQKASWNSYFKLKVQSITFAATAHIYCKISHNRIKILPIEALWPYSKKHLTINAMKGEEIKYITYFSICLVTNPLKENTKEIIRQNKPIVLKRA